MAEDWSELLPELLLTIAEAIPYYEDLISFSEVCSSWQSAVDSVMENKSTNLPPSRFPYLLVTDKTPAAGGGKEESELPEEESRFYYLSGGGGAAMIRKVQLPEVHDMMCLSSRGWLITIDKEAVNAKLIDPLSHRQIELPKLHTLPMDVRIGNPVYADKLFVSFDPEKTTTKEEDLLVMIIWKNVGWVGFCRPGDDRWTPVRSRSATYDFVYHNRKVYTCDCWGKIMGFDVDDDKPAMKVVSHIPGCDDLTKAQGYLLELDGKLLVVLKEGPWDEKEFQEFEFNEEYEDDDDDDGDSNGDDNAHAQEEEDYDHLTNRFCVFEFNLRTSEWSEVDNLGDRAIFIGSNSSFWVTASGCVKANCIYFTDDVWVWVNKGKGSIDMGVYHMSDGSIEPHFNVVSFNPDSPPMWIEPSSN